MFNWTDSIIVGLSQVFDVKGVCLFLIWVNVGLIVVMVVLLLFALLINIVLTLEERRLFNDRRSKTQKV